ITTHLRQPEYRHRLRPACGHAPHFRFVILFTHETFIGAFIFRATAYNGASLDTCAGAVAAQTHLNGIEQLWSRSGSHALALRKNLSITLWPPTRPARVMAAILSALVSSIRSLSAA